MQETRHQWSDKSFISGHAVLDFTNTVANQDKSRSLNLIEHWSGFVGWANGATLFNEYQSGLLNAEMGADNSSEENNQQALLKELSTLRETLYRVLSALATNNQVPEADWHTLIKRVKTAINRAEFKATTNQYGWQACTSNPDWITDTLLLSFEALLRSQEIEKIRQCGRCSWLFLNKGRGKGRRWCDMTTCGNRAKIESYRQK